MRAQQARIINYMEVYQERASRFDGFTLTTSCTLARNNLNVILNGEGSEAHLYGLYEIDGQEHVDNRTIMDHAVPNCFSNELYKGILRDKAEGVFNGKIIVRPDAQKTNAFQHNANLILSEDAAINAKPQLEIFADDVKCSHGATSGQLDEEHMFYLRQRGLGKEDAKALLTYAFASEIVEKITVPELSDYMDQELRGRLLM
jgi:Fe-S cluster assembly protein SufD